MGQVPNTQGQSMHEELAAEATADREAKRLGVTRQSVIKVWIAERLERRVP